MVINNVKCLRAKKVIRFIIIAVLALAVLIAGSTAVMNLIIIKSTKGNILSLEGAAENKDYDCIIVLGAKVMPDGTLSPILKDRVQVGLDLYFNGAAPKLLMSGDHGRKGYDEVGAMKDFAVNAGVDSRDLFMDHAGFSTYESVYRAKEIFGAKRVLIVTQEYHLYRALYIAERLGLQADGVTSDLRNYQRPLYNGAREYLARVKAFVMCIYKPEPTYLGETIPIYGDGNLTND